MKAIRYYLAELCSISPHWPGVFPHTDHCQWWPTGSAAICSTEWSYFCYSVPLTGRACDPTDCPWNSPGQNTGVGSLSLLQGIFPTQGSNPGLLRCKQILYQLSHKGSPMFCKSTSNASAKSMLQSFPGGSVVKNLLANAGDMSSTPGLGRYPGEGNGNLPQHSCLGNPTCLADYSPWDCKVVRHDLAMKQQQS